MHGSLDAANDALRAQTKNLLQSDLALHDSEHRLRAVANNVPALIGYWSADLRCEFANEAYRELFHLEPQRVLGMHLKDLLGSGSLSGHRSTRARGARRPAAARPTDHAEGRRITRHVGHPLCAGSRRHARARLLRIGHRHRPLPDYVTPEMTP
jgi:PAS domain-containing protein